MASTLTLTALEGIPSIAAGDDLAALILSSARASALDFRDGDILVLAQKIVSKAEGRQVSLIDVKPSPRAIELAAEAQKDARVVELILRESREIIRSRPGLIIVEHRLGLVMANAGIDASNVDRADQDDAVLLLPVDPDRSAAAIREAIRAATRAHVGVVINDSFGRAWRMGTIGTAIGVAGLPALVDMRGQPDRNGRILQSTEVGVADEVAAAASLLMGQAAEGRPVIHVRGFPYDLREGKAGELIRPRQMDLFR
jgi:coenzyme F420-0:L-glutamate ligase/coenzyme F420-1:gamma-L-glutamate ligase